jgi:hypothetical protein
VKRTPLRRTTGLRPGKPLARRGRLQRVTPLRTRPAAGRSGMARPDEPLATWCEAAIPGVCQRRAMNRHHRLRRSQGGGDEKANTMDVCGSGTTGCHGAIHANPAESYAKGWLIRSAA